MIIKGDNASAAHWLYKQYEPAGETLVVYRETNNIAGEHCICSMDGLFCV